MSNPIIKTYEPQFYKNFQCIGGDCEDTCCAGWNVHIDKDTYQKYQKLTEPSLKERFDTQMKLKEENWQDKENYEIVATIQMDEKHNCPFCNKQGLCDIQKTVGEEHLSDTCTLYPRKTSFYINALNSSLMLSCPEAARKVLLEDKLTFEYSEKEAPALHQVDKALHGNDENQNFYQIQEFLIRTLQNREQSLETRLFATAYFCQKLDERPEKLKRWMTKVESLLNDGSFQKQFSQLETDIEVSLSFIHKFFEGIALNGAYRLVECLNSYRDGLGINNDKIDSKEKFTQAAKTLFDPFVDEKKNLLENYCVHYIYTAGLPYAESMNSFKNFSQLIIHYSMIKTLCIGIAAEQGFIDEATVIKVVQSLTKIVDHNDQNLASFIKYLEENDGLTLAHMAVLLKHS